MLAMLPLSFKLFLWGSLSGADQLVVAGWDKAVA